jgi:hypothetical protein
MASSLILPDLSGFSKPALHPPRSTDRTAVRKYRISMVMQKV